MKSNTLPIGKLQIEHLDKLLQKYSISDDRVIVGAGIGRDAAVIDWGEKYLVAKTDPITFVTDEIGFYAVTINANDIACTGGTPRWFMATLLLPEKDTNPELIESIMSQISTTCKMLKIGLIGGHTEITTGIDRPIVVGQMLGDVQRNKLVRPEAIQAGDLVILTKGIAIEGVSILAREREEEILKKFGEKFLKRAKNFLHEPGISVLKDAQIATRVARIHGMHDPTEGGLLTGLHELTRAAKVSLEILPEKIPVLEAARQLCDYFQLDPLGVIASGALIIVTDPVDADVVVKALKEEGISAEIIGTVLPPGQGVVFRRGNDVEKAPKFEQDELTKIFETE
ncbi:MAG: hydrogenase expression/formation protein [Calditrichaeota bacterium]|nr:hydrogenase expression/formation protein [Calditrichota bacterium]